MQTTDISRLINMRVILEDEGIVSKHQKKKRYM